MRRLQFALSASHLGLFDDLTIAEHLHLTARIYGLGKDESHARIEQLLRVLGLGEGRNTFAGYGSHGMRKKTAFAMAVLPNPYFQVTDKDGKFDLKNLPPGTYTVIAWHELYKTDPQTITIGPKESKSVNFTFKATASGD